jgi:phosphoribosylaminoimidazolecarboxamide formyltransferase/IMP cyclohydrolase
MLKIKRALISVSDKTGIVDLAQALVALGVEIVSTGGTAKMLKAAGLNVIEMADYTGFPEMLDGRVKTLHPKIHGGLLSLRDNPDHMAQVREHGIGLIDMVVVNLYPFEATVSRADVALEKAIENIDIGGPSMLRSAAKNYRSVAVISSPAFYPRVIAQLKEKKGLAPEFLEEMAVEVFKTTAHYDSVIAGYLREKLGEGSGTNDSLPEILSYTLSKVTSLRYGENPHQKAALYRLPENVGPCLANAKQLSGKELSFNNYLDLQAALGIMAEFEAPSSVIIKHNNPTGVASHAKLSTALSCAWKSDPLSAFGGIIGFNRPVDVTTAQALLKSGFIECVLAPGYHPHALTLLMTKKNVRLLELEMDKVDRTRREAGLDFKKIDGGILIQEEDRADYKAADLKVVTKKKPTARQMEALRFAWKVVKHVKSNAIVLAAGAKTVGIGMGQTSRVDSIFMAVKRAGARSRGAVMASDAFLPKEDNVVLAKKAGVKAIIQPGGSIADAAVIKACDKAGIAMVMTGMRHFKH